MRRGLAIALVYLGLILVPVADRGRRSCRRSSRRATTSSTTLPQLRARPARSSSQENRRLRQLERGLRHHRQARGAGRASCPARLGDAAGVLSDIGLGVVNSLFAAITILVLSAFMISSGARAGCDAFADRQPPDRARVAQAACYDRIGDAVGNYVAGALLQADDRRRARRGSCCSILGVPYALPLAVDRLPARPRPARRRDARRDHRRRRHAVQRLPGRHDHLGGLVDRLPAGREHGHPAAHPGARGRTCTRSSCSSSVLFGSTLFGVLGALLAIPVAAAIQISIREYVAFRDTPAEDLPPPGVAAARGPTAAAPRPAPSSSSRRRRRPVEQAGHRRDPAAEHEARHGGADHAPASGCCAGACASRSTSATSPRRRSTARPSSARLASIERRISSGVRVVGHQLPRLAGRRIGGSTRPPAPIGSAGREARWSP